MCSTASCPPAIISGPTRKKEKHNSLNISSQKFPACLIDHLSEVVPTPPSLCTLPWSSRARQRAPAASPNSLHERLGVHACIKSSAHAPSIAASADDWQVLPTVMRMLQRRSPYSILPFTCFFFAYWNIGLYSQPFAQSMGRTLQLSSPLPTPLSTHFTHHVVRRVCDAAVLAMVRRRRSQ